MIDFSGPYARLLIELGVNLQKGQKLNVTAEAAHQPFVRELARQAYARGASYVHWDVVDPEFLRVRLDHSAIDDLDYVPSWSTAYWNELVEHDWATIYVDGSAAPRALQGADAARVARRMKSYSQKRSFYLDAITSSKICWNVASYPTPAWAARVLNGPENPGSFDEFVRGYARVLRLDDADPIAAWTRDLDALASRCRTLQELELDALEFRGEGTDLTVGLLKASRWRGGRERAQNGRLFAPNLPTEEVFTTPDWRRTEGYARCTRPVDLMGTEIVDASFVFRTGRVVECRAKTGCDVLERYLASDEQSNALGEVALVDGSSRIFESGWVFHSILFDENAACHIALGSGYRDATTLDPGLTKKEYLEAGCNDSIVHTDFMIGGPGIDVTGVRSDGRRVPLLQRGRFCI